jgi:hypothetical protein
VCAAPSGSLHLPRNGRHARSYDSFEEPGIVLAGGAGQSLSPPIGCPGEFSELGEMGRIRVVWEPHVFVSWLITLIAREARELFK